MCGALVYNKNVLINMHGMNIKISVYCICKNNNLLRCARGLPIFAGRYVMHIYLVTYSMELCLLLLYCSYAPGAQQANRKLQYYRPPTEILPD